jgi:hypothetical protein
MDLNNTDDAGKALLVALIMSDLAPHMEGVPSIAYSMLELTIRETANIDDLDLWIKEKLLQSENSRYWKSAGMHHPIYNPKP